MESKALGRLETSVGDTDATFAQTEIRSVDATDISNTDE